jgi:hypothetical protein
VVHSLPIVADPDDFCPDPMRLFKTSGSETLCSYAPKQLGNVTVSGTIASFADTIDDTGTTS